MQDSTGHPGYGKIFPLNFRFKTFGKKQVEIRIDQDTI